MLRFVRSNTAQVISLVASLLDEAAKVISPDRPHDPADDFTQVDG